ncbi:MAG: hypothetical protein IKS20_04645, partial [Victivallales bacterium]|nr:hypothetical protein [Victivallales bacterium]
QATSLKYNKNEETYLATTKDLLLEGGKYYISVEHPNAKKGGSADFTVAYGGKTYFFEVDDKEDNVFTGDEVQDFGGDWSDWVGLGDSVDYCRLDLSEIPARVSFDLNASDAAKFTVWQLNEKTGKLKSVQSTALKLDKQSGEYSATTKSLLLAKGTYYVSMESTNAKKGGNADFTVAFGEDVRYFDEADNSNDTWKAAAENEERFICDNVYGWVGFGDATDFYAFYADEAGKLSLTFDEDTEAAIKAKKLKVSCLDAKGKTISLGALKDGSMDSSKALAEGTYYLGVACTNVQKYDSYYNVSIGMLA